MNNSNSTTAPQDAGEQSAQNTAQKGQAGQKGGEKQGAKADIEGGSATEESSKR